MSDDYVYQEPKQPDFGPLPPGDYPFTVAEVQPTYISEAGNFVLPVRLAVGDQGVPVFDSPSAGASSKIGPYDRIAAFLKCINKHVAPGQKPDLSNANLKGARGYLRLKVEIAQQGQLAGKPVNRVHYYILDKDDLNIGSDLVPPDVPRTKTIIVPPPPAAKGGKDPVDLPF